MKLRERFPLQLLLLVLLGACGGYTQPTLPGPRINSFTAAETLITAGDGTTLTADFVNGVALIDHGVGPVIDDLPVPVQPLESTTYTLTDSDPSGAHVSRSVTVVPVPVIAQFSASPARLAGVPSGQGSVDGTAARYHGPAGVVQDAAGNLLVADTLNHTIRKRDTAGRVSTLAGQEGEPGSTDGLGRAARFNLPMGLAIDSDTGALLVADSGNDTIRLVTPGGQVSTLAGAAGLPGDLDGVGTGARLRAPTGIAFGEVQGVPAVFVADTGNATIRMILMDGLESDHARRRGQHHPGQPGAQREPARPAAGADLGTLGHRRRSRHRRYLRHH